MLFVLFVCTANQFRSPLAVACFMDLLNKMDALGEWRVESAGTWTIPGLPASTAAIRVADYLGLPGLNAHRTRQVDQELLDQFDLILVMEVNHLETISNEFSSVYQRLNLLSEVADGFPYSILDPGDQNSDPSAVAIELQELIQRGQVRIMELAQSLHNSRREPGYDDS